MHGTSKIICMESIQSWEELSRETLFGKYGRGMEKVIFRLPNGTETDFYLKKEVDSVCVVAITREGKVITTKQFRPGPKEILSELPGGCIEGGESAKEAIARELLEETGYAGNIQEVSYMCECAYSSKNRHCFVATDCEKVANQKLDDNEFAEVELISMDKFRSLLRSGRMTDVAAGYLGLDYLNLL